MDEVAALEQLKSLHQRKTQQIEHVKTLTAEFRQWRGNFTAQLGAQREDMQNMRKQLHEDALKQRSEFQEMQAELQRQLEDLISSNLSAFPILEAGEHSRPREPQKPPEPDEPHPHPPPPPKSSSRHAPPHSDSERRTSSSTRRQRSGVQAGSRKAPPAAPQDSSLAVKLSHELGIPVELLAASSSTRPAPLPEEPEPRRAPLKREGASDARLRGGYGTGAASRRTRSHDTDDESVASSRYSGERSSARSARSDSGSPTSSAYSSEDDASDYSDYSSGGTSGRGDYSYSDDSDASSFSDSAGSRHSTRGGGGNGTGRR